MLQIKKILFPTDYSACAEQAFSQAAYLAERYDAAVHVLHVTEPSAVLKPLGLTEADVAADLHLPTPESAQAEAPSSDEEALLHVEVPPVEGSVERAILDYAAQQDCDLIVMGTHGRRALDRLFLGSVAGKVVRLAECPVFTVGVEARSPAQGAVQRILVPIDFSEHARLALAYASDLAATYGAHLDLLHVVEETALPIIYGIEPVLVQVSEVQHQARQALERLVREVGVADGSYNVHVTVGHPASDIVGFAERQGIDLVVIATHGLTGIKRLLLGSVAERVVHRAPCPVFTVKGFGKRLLTPVAATEVVEQPVP